MSEPTPTPATLRLFISLYPPNDAAAAMSALTADLSRARVRRVPTDQIHMTVLFLGDRPANTLDAIAASIRAAATGTGPVTLTPRRLITLPERLPPRLIALEAQSTPNLHALYQRLIAAFPTLGDRPANPTLLPHFTLCRFRPGASSRPMSTPTAIPPFTVPDLQFMRSELRPEGPRHTLLASIPLT